VGTTGKAVPISPGLAARTLNSHPVVGEELNSLFTVADILRRFLITSFTTTLLPLFGLPLFGGCILFWFTVALSLGVIVGDWSIITSAPTLLPVLARR
jgi:preprotein translocase subunit SecF